MDGPGEYMSVPFCESEDCCPVPLCVTCDRSFTEAFVGDVLPVVAVISSGLVVPPTPGAVCWIV